LCPPVEFYSWYADLTEVLASIISKKTPGRAGDVGARAVAARRAADREAGAGRLRANAFQLISSCINVRGEAAGEGAKKLAGAVCRWQRRGSGCMGLACRKKRGGGLALPACMREAT
jgi:hypothetical protein